MTVFTPKPMSSVTSRPLQDLEKSEKIWWKWMNMLLPMMLVILLALF